ncbi:histone-lysine N-methyltransferase setd3 [Morus notabilis]|uniref:histone-lysine N-methyltransferase setd3 n=1 Tax=Morus notabilis TaxID=981085 RepID=UPI000CECEE75|nr:histone-lysine N-methyltransferase setd3 [Morus notabilis]
MEGDKPLSTHKAAESEDKRSFVFERPRESDSLLREKKPLLTQNAVELDDNCTFVLELPESDSLFYEKKNLLQKKGFNTKEQIRITSSSLPDSISASLNEMLQITRIINLDEVELYFLEDDASSPVDSYSFRNELASLNSILRLVENSLCDCTEMQKNILQELRASIAGMIDKLRIENNLESVILEDHCCDRENRLLQWGVENGMTSRLRIAYVEGAGRGAIAREDLNVGDTALEIPTSLIISDKLVKKSDMYHILEEKEMSSETMLLLWSMKEKYNANSKFKVYFDTLPEEFLTGLSFGVDALVLLDETALLQEIMEAKEHIRNQYEQLVPSLCEEHPDIFPPELFTCEQFLWACELWYSNSMKIMFPDGELRTCLVPVAGFLNHWLYPHITSYGKVHCTTNTLKFCLSRACDEGEECFLSYGNFSSSHLVTFYGFVPKGDNPYDVIPLELECDEDNFDEGSQAFNLTHMARGTWFSNNYEIFHYGLPSPLLDKLRKTQNPLLHTKVLLQGSLEYEIEILEQVHDIFGNMMDNLGEDLDDLSRKEASWDVKLAIEYKDILRKIMASITSSCHLGIYQVKDELSKIMDEDTRG